MYRTKEGKPDDTIVQVLSSTLESECTFIVVKLNFVGSNPAVGIKSSMRQPLFTSLNGKAGHPIGD